MGPPGIEPAVEVGEGVKVKRPVGVLDGVAVNVFKGVKVGVRLGVEEAVEVAV